MRRTRLAHALWLTLAAALCARLDTLRQAGAEGEPFHVLFPQDESVVESGKFDLLCVASQGKGDVSARPELLVDGEPASWQPYAAPVLSARLDLDSGLHEIAVESVKLRVYVPDDSDPPDDVSDWPLLQTHAGKAGGWKDCAACHELSEEGERTAVGEVREPVACLKCHTEQDFELAHFHPLDPLASCHTCHALHGSTRPSLLNAPVKELCAECHD